MAADHVVLFKAGWRGASPIEKIVWRTIQKATKGPYVHAEILLDENSGLTIGADRIGIRYGKLAFNTANYDIVPLATLISDQARKAGALDLIKKRIGERYGVWDIVDEAFMYLFKKDPVRILVTNQFDCSDFVAYYLDRAGVQLPDDWSYPYVVSPNDLGRFFQGKKLLA